MSNRAHSIDDDVAAMRHEFHLEMGEEDKVLPRSRRTLLVPELEPVMGVIERMDSLQTADSSISSHPASPAPNQQTSYLALAKLLRPETRIGPGPGFLDNIPLLPQPHATRPDPLPLQLARGKGPCPLAYAATTPLRPGTGLYGSLLSLPVESRGGYGGYASTPGNEVVKQLLDKIEVGMGATVVFVEGSGAAE